MIGVWHDIYGRSWQGERLQNDTASIKSQDRPSRLQGQPLIFVSHGTHDQVLPVRAGRRIVEKLHEADYDVTYQEFNGPHTVPPEIAREGFDWFMKTPATTVH